MGKHPEMVYNWGAATVTMHAHHFKLSLSRVKLQHPKVDQS
jgi:hypothetical protein